ncbi:MAG TPA: glycine cleavage system aminomethyltransferase GcvT [Steroidobacteraceae bacterium]|nr:glycine cleavage system aminomethyltransferase GcvT [Steroidobacteraceae bacterium]
MHEARAGRRTVLHDLHVQLGARMVDFGGWDMPVAYGSQIEEHHAVRRAAGVFDVSHMGIVDLAGARAREFLRHVLANDVARLAEPGKALYTCMLNEQGGVIDDLIVYLQDAEHYRLVVNAGTRDGDLAWLRQQSADWNLALAERTDLAMLAVQGPEARPHVAALLPTRHAAAALALQNFHGAQLGDWFVARTGYTGEDGFEVMLPATQAAQLWQQLNARGVRSCGLGARDTLRLEAGMNLYGNDMDLQHDPLQSGLAWTVAFEPPERGFIGRRALEALRAGGLQSKMVGVVLEDRAVLRGHQKVRLPGTEFASGEITSGTFSPTLSRSIGLARVPAGAGAEVEVEIRGKWLGVRVVKPPFVRHGRALV